MRFIIVIFTLLTSVVLMGCANHTNAYIKNGKQISGLIVPPGMPALKQNNYYPIPKVVPETGRQVTLVPPTLTDNS